MRISFCLLLVALVGCESLGKTLKVKNPVVGPPPRRVSNLLTDVPRDDSATADGVRQAKAEGDGKGDVVLAGTPTEKNNSNGTVYSGEVAAFVNGVPIFCDEVLERFADRLAKAEQQMPPADYQQLRREIVRQHMKVHIERQLLIQALKRHLKDEQFTGMSKHLDQLWEEEVQRIAKEFGVSTPGELDAELRKGNTSLDAQHDEFRNQKMAQQYMALKSMPKAGFDRPDLLAYYQEHISDYEYPAEVKWQQILLLFTDHGGKEKTRQLAAQLVNELQTGSDFAALAKKHSRGPTASSGGVWEWTKADSLADKKVEQMLFTLPVGQVSSPLETNIGVQIVRVLDRKNAGRQSFESVQADIKETLRKSEYKRTAESLLRELFDESDVRTMFDNDRG